ncbi:MAG: 3'-5' exonuclease [Steroidobacteraceae bacterium]|nr:ATP-binding domain-containing protein [Nevskiaceae bacterium]
MLIDEGHDFLPDWLRLAVQMLDPSTNHLLLLYDDAQSIYSNKRTGAFSFRSVGISAAGRTKILRRNYRNTNDILACARTFAEKLLTPVDAVEDGVPLLYPETGGRSGVRPRYMELASVKQEARQIGREILAQHEAGVAWNQIGVFYTAPFVAEEIALVLETLKVPFDWLRDAASKTLNPTRPSVKLMTPHSSKGLQYKVAIIGGLGFWPYKSEVDEARLLYVAMTRATHELVITSSKSSIFSERMRRLCA